MQNPSRIDLINNRKADLVAKEILDGYDRTCSTQAVRELCDAQRHHLWLVQMHKYLSDDTANKITKDHTAAPVDQRIEVAPTNHRELYPRCTWDSSGLDYDVASPAIDDDFTGHRGPVYT